MLTPEEMYQFIEAKEDPAYLAHLDEMEMKAAQYWHNLQQQELQAEANNDSEPSNQARQSGKGEHHQ